MPMKEQQERDLLTTAGQGQHAFTYTPSTANTRPSTTAETTPVLTSTMSSVRRGEAAVGSSSRRRAGRVSERWEERAMTFGEHYVVKNTFIHTGPVWRAKIYSMGMDGWMDKGAPTWIGEAHVYLRVCHMCFVVVFCLFCLLSRVCSLRRPVGVGPGPPTATTTNHSHTVGTAPYQPKNTPTTPHHATHVSPSVRRSSHPIVQPAASRPRERVFSAACAAHTESSQHPFVSAPSACESGRPQHEFARWWWWWWCVCGRHWGG